MRSLIFIVFFLLPFAGFSQSNADLKVHIDTIPHKSDSIKELFISIDGCATYPGGESVMTKYIKNNLKYPESAQEIGVEGRVIIRFLVNLHGDITDVELVRGIDPYCDKEALRVVKSMPKWVPCRPNLRPVACWFTIPIDFKFVKDDTSN